MSLSDAAQEEAAGRKGDGIILLAQNNDEKRLYIRTANETACNLLGYATGELDGLDLSEIIPPKRMTELLEDLEFDDDAPDIGQWLARQRDFRLRHRLGQDVAQPFTVSRLMSQGHDACFQLVLPNERDNRAQQQLKDFLRLNLEGQQQLDAATGLPDRATAETYLRVLNSYVAGNGMQAAFVVIRLDRHGKSLARYGREACVELIKHVANCCRSTFRSEDVVCALSDHTLGIVLLDLSRESARVVLNRLRWNVRSHRMVFGGKSDFSNTISLSFDMLDTARGDGLFDRCEHAITALDAESRNQLIELGQ